MKTTLLKSRSLAVTLLILLVGLGLGLSSIRQGSTNTATPAATVDGQQIPARIFQMYLKNGIEAMGLSDKTPEGRRQIETLKETILADLIDRALVEAEARRRGVSLTAAEIDGLRGKRVEQMGGAEVYRAYLGQHSLTDDDFLAIIRQEALGEKMRGELTKDLTVPEGDARAFYDKEKANPELESTFVEPERVRASHILIGARRHQIASGLRDKAKDQAGLDRLVNEEMNRRRARAEQILARAKSGEDFARIAAEVSDDPGTRGRGGDLGLFARNAHTAKFDDAAFGLKPGEVSGIVETEYGYHVIKLAERNPRRTKPFEEVRAVIEQHLLALKRAKQLNGWLEARRREAAIDIAPAYRVGKFMASK